MRKLSLAILAILSWPMLASAQDVSARYQGQLIGSRGLPLGNQSVAVCTQPANTTTQPCSPLATLATSTSTTSGGTNPLTTDVNGNFFFYAVPGKYTVQAYGPQVSGQFVQPDTLLLASGPVISSTGSPSNGNLVVWSSGSTVTNGNLSGDVSTSGGTATTLATVATPGTNTKVTFNAKGLVTAGAQAQLASADYANQGTTTTVLHGNAAGNPGFSQVSLANDVTGNLPVANVAPGANGQCLNTSGGVTVWGSCAGTAGEQVVNVNTTPVTVNAAVTSLQPMQSFTIGAGNENSVGKTFRLTSEGSVAFVNTTESVTLEYTVGGIGVGAIIFTPTSTSTTTWDIIANCTTTTSGGTGVIFCAVHVTLSIGNSIFQVNSTSASPLNLANTLTVQNAISFSTASGTNTATSNYFLVEQLQ